MPTVDIDVLNQMLFETERTAHQRGWEQPDILFALEGDAAEPELTYVLQLPGRAGDQLQELIAAGMQARPGVLGLVLVAGAGIPLDVDGFLELPLRAEEQGEAERGMPRRVAAVWEALRSDMAGQVCSRAVVAVLRDGHVAVVLREGEGRPRLVERIPSAVADHDEVAGMVMRLLVGDKVPMPRTATSWPRSLIA